MTIHVILSISTFYIHEQICKSSGYYKKNFVHLGVKLGAAFNFTTAQAKNMQKYTVKILIRVIAMINELQWSGMQVKNLNSM